MVVIFQAFAPVKTLTAVRTAGQVAHNNIELALLQQKWAAAKIAIHSVTFEFKQSEAPLSWHLTSTEVQDIRSAWDTDMEKCRQDVKAFINSDSKFNCGCLVCESIVERV